MSDYDDRRRRSKEHRPDGSRRKRSRAHSPSGRVHTHTRTRDAPLVRAPATKVVFVLPSTPPPRARPPTPTTGTPEAKSQARMKRAETEALRGLQDMHHAACEGAPLWSPLVQKTLSRLDEAAQMRNVHSHRYYGTPNDGHRYQVELLDRTFAETVNFFTGRSTSLASTAKALRKYTAPASPAPLPPPGYSVPAGTKITPDRVPHLLVFGEHGSA